LQHFAYLFVPNAANKLAANLLLLQSYYKAAYFVSKQLKDWSIYIKIGRLLASINFIFLGK